MKIFMRRMYQSDNSNGTFTNGKHDIDWEQVFEDKYCDESDLYIDDKMHHAECWGSCYDESDINDMIIRRRKKNEEKK